MNKELSTRQAQSVKTFWNLDAWKEAHEFVLMIYRITQDFPKAEMFGLTSQIRRAVISITSNIAEGFSRQSYKEKIQFYFTALGSVTEVQSQITIARDVGYINSQQFQDIDNQAIRVHKIVHGLIKGAKRIASSA